MDTFLPSSADVLTVSPAGPVIHLTETPYGVIAWRSDGPANGQETAPPLLLLQRFRGTMEDWDPAFITALTANRQVIRFDNAGIGHSGGAVPDSIEGMAEVAAAFLSVAGFERVDVLGWSLGGFVGQHLALDHPGLVRRLIVAGSGAGPTPEGQQQNPEVPQVMTRPVNSVDDFLFLFYPDTPTARMSGLQSLVRIQNQPRIGPRVGAEAMMAQLKAIMSWTGLYDRLADLTLPVLVANGAHDVMIPAYRSFLLSQKAPNARLVIYPDAGHGFLFQHITDFAHQVDLFLSA